MRRLGQACVSVVLALFVFGLIVAGAAIPKLGALIILVLLLALLTAVIHIGLF